MIAYAGIVTIVLIALALYSANRINTLQSQLSAWVEYSYQCEDEIRKLQAENVDLRFGKIKIKRINENVGIGMLPDFDKGVKGKTPVMDSEGNIALFDKNRVPDTEIDSLNNPEAIPVYESMPEITFYPDPTLESDIANLAYDITGIKLGRNKPNTSNGKGNTSKSNGNSSNKDQGPFQATNTDLFGNDSPFWTLVETICNDRGIKSGKLPQDQFNWLKDKYPEWNKKPADNAEYKNRFDSRFPK